MMKIEDMTLLDYFAAKAMVVHMQQNAAQDVFNLANADNDLAVTCNTLEDDVLAEWAYDMAEAMMEERRLRATSMIRTAIVESGTKEAAMALCPWHKEKTPSLRVDLPTDTFHCYGCGAKGKLLSKNDVDVSLIRTDGK